MPQAIDRDRLRALLLSLAEAVAEMGDQQIKAHLPRLLPPQLRPMAGLLTLPSQSVTRSTMSALATRLSDELSDDELWALWRLIKDQASKILDVQDGESYMRTRSPEQRDAAIAHLREILSG